MYNDGRVVKTKYLQYYPFHSPFIVIRESPRSSGLWIIGGDYLELCIKILPFRLFGWLVADGWCWFVLREEYCWLVAGGWFVLREKYCWLVADKPSE
jgi:hypothetical protein